MSELPEKTGADVWAAFGCSVNGWALIEIPTLLQMQVRRMLSAKQQWDEGGRMAELCHRVLGALRQEFGTETGQLELVMALDFVSAAMKVSLRNHVREHLQSEAN